MTVNTEILLDKLYNLRGSDSDILKEMDRQKNKAEQTKDRTTESVCNKQAIPYEATPQGCCRRFFASPLS